MKPLKQRNKHDPENGLWGDCHRAAIASIFELPLDDVPHFCDGGISADEFQRLEREWLLARGIAPIAVPYSGEDLEAVLRTISVCAPDMHYLLGGRSRTGVNHTVVGYNAEIVHDPSPTDAGIVGPCDDGYFWATFFGIADLHRRAA